MVAAAAYQTIINAVIVPVLFQSDACKAASDLLENL
jgi:hypothetical protein